MYFYEVLPARSDRQGKLGKLFFREPVTASLA